MFLKRLLNCVLLKKTLQLNKCQTRTGYYQPYRSGDQKYEDEREEKYERLSEWDKLVGGWHALKYECKLWGHEIKDQYSLDSTLDKYADKEIVKLWDFDQRNNDIISSKNNNNFSTNDMSRWRTSCDSDHNEGYSQCEWTVSPSGRALFTGNTDTKLPMDGRIQYAGWAFLGCEKHRKSFFRQNHFDWMDFTHLLIRCRGDGRNWFIILNTSDDNVDITWFDRYQYVLYTHGGPYWQWCKIPFSRFYMQHKGYTQEVQNPIPMEYISQIGFLINDRNSGPFSLEIDYVGAMKDLSWTEETAYEKYYHEENKFLSPGST